MSFAGYYLIALGLALGTACVAIVIGFTALLWLDIREEWRSTRRPKS